MRYGVQKGLELWARANRADLNFKILIFISLKCFYDFSSILPFWVDKWTNWFSWKSIEYIRTSEFITGSIFIVSYIVRFMSISKGARKKNWNENIEWARPGKSRENWNIQKYMLRQRKKKLLCTHVYVASNVPVKWVFMWF